MCLIFVVEVQGVPLSYLHQQDTKSCKSEHLKTIFPSSIKRAPYNHYMEIQEPTMVLVAFVST